MTDSPTIITARTGADLLAMLPLLAGGPIRSSIAIAPFAGKRTPGVLRHALPATGETREMQAIAGALLGMISRLGGCDGVAIAIYTDESFDTALAAHTELEEILRTRFLSAGFAVKDTFCVAADGWACFDERERRELSEIDDGPVIGDRFPGDEPRHRLDGSLPRTDPALAAHVSVTLDELDLGFRTDAFGAVHLYDLPDPIALLEAALEEEPNRLGAESLAEIVLCHQYEGDFDRTITQVCLGSGRAADVWAKILDTRRRAAQNGEEPIDLMLRERRRGGQPSGDEIGGLLTGVSGTTPDAARVHAAIAVLSRAAAHAPMLDRPTLLCVLAWLHWALGRGSAAGTLLETANRIDPSHELTLIISHVVRTVTLPAWLLDRDLRELTDDGAARRRRRRPSGRR